MKEYYYGHSGIGRLTFYWENNTILPTLNTLSGLYRTVPIIATSDIPSPQLYRKAKCMISYWLMRLKQRGCYQRYTIPIYIRRLMKSVAVKM